MAYDSPPHERLENVRAERDAALAELERLMSVIRKIDALHYICEDDYPHPYCPECQAYDGNPNPCPTSELTRSVLAPTAR